MKKEIVISAIEFLFIVLIATLLFAGYQEDPICEKLHVCQTK